MTSATEEYWGQTTISFGDSRALATPILSYLPRKMQEKRGLSPIFPIFSPLHPRSPRKRGEGA
jgi:hypothetical protein